MKVLGISGSMRKDGNTAALVRKIVDYVDTEGCDEFETEFISLAGKKINPCMGCEKCREAKWCVQKDDWTEVANKIVNCDVLVFGSPTYFYDVNGQTKNLIDRTYSLYHDRKLNGKYSVVVSVCADRGCERTLESLEGFVNTHGFSYLGYVSGRGFKEGEVLNDLHAQKKCTEVAEKILKLVSNTHRDSKKSE
ncbi:flavodoxin family protein [Methanoplanus sp. FWC-SCC4]|uniref:Flavodoxin family protein n=1 Tax=Methanochimaera problematica TaxID=2609417 RepID=A0AA97FCI0_9EURY|nr:flavodoxin family protein [Methanoplanus sp. FWC-SCC4]WOF16895.1 flavodoxin family protein [Methanoplanus sp. FWC-SCC4]